MKKLHFIFLFITILLLSCGGPTTENKIAESKEITGDQGAPFKYWTWITYKSQNELRSNMMNCLKNLKEMGWMLYWLIH